MSDMNYKKAGVDIDEGERFVKMISPLVKTTFRKEVMTDLGSFSGLFNLDLKKFPDPVLVSGTDGVGTKLKVAFMADKHNTVGIDLVAMCVNDILTCGAEPLFFLDYFATGKLSAEKAKDVIEGIADGCRQSGSALIGGETAEMPGFYPDGEYDLSGFSVGAVNRDDIIDGSTVQEGDVVVGLRSNGIHSNGYSLVRKVFFEKAGMKADTYVEEFGHSLGEELLRPTKIYVNAWKALKEAGVTPSAMAHVTGGGIKDNLPRVLPDNLGAEIDESKWPTPAVFTMIQKIGGVPLDDMRRTFNMGIGYILVIKQGELNKTLETLAENSYYDCDILGTIIKGKGAVRYI
jgi:phosphoribosylformylglycinamidine cyclo-ligase